MSDTNKASSSGRKIIKIKGIPLRLDQLKIIKNERSDIFTKGLIQHLGYKEETIYESCQGDFLSGEYQNVCLVNKLNLKNNSCVTRAKFVSRNGETFERDSLEITKLIGQKNYDVLFFALCSIINTEMKVRAMIALLTKSKNFNTVACQIAEDCTENREMIFNEQNFKNMEDTSLKRRRIRKKVTPYVVRTEQKTENQKIKKIIIANPSFMKSQSDLDSTPVKDQNGDLNGAPKGLCANSNGKDLVDLKDELRGSLNYDSDSNHSDGNLSIGSLRSYDLSEGAITNLYSKIDHMTQKEQMQIRPNIDRHNIVLLDGTTLKLYAKPEDQFHLITPETLYNLTKEEKQKLLKLQAVIDFKLCLTRNEHDNLPLHEAVLHGDEDLVRRQCVVLKGRDVSVDITANGLTPLQMSVCQGNNPKCTALLLQHGADPLLTDSEQKSILHIAAEAPVGHLKEILEFCRVNARRILEMEGDIEQSKLKSDEELANMLFTKMGATCDDQGYTPLMLAAKVGNTEHVKALLQVAPSVVDVPMPNSGNTALYLTVAAACVDAIECGNRSKVRQNFEETIGCLVERGADPDYRNHSGANISELLTEFNMTDLSTRIANTLITKYSDGTVPIVKNYDSYMLLRDSMGTVKVEQIERPVEKCVASDVRIIENIPVVNAVTDVTSRHVKQEPFDAPQTVHPKSFIIITKKSPDSSVANTETSERKGRVKEIVAEPENITKYVIKKMNFSSAPKDCKTQTSAQTSLSIGNVASEEKSSSSDEINAPFKRKQAESSSSNTVKKKKG